MILKSDQDKEIFLAFTETLYLVNRNNVGKKSKNIKFKLILSRSTNQ